MAAIGYWRCKPWGTYVHLLALVQQLLIIPFVAYSSVGIIVWISIILSFPIVVLMAIHLKIRLSIIAIIIGIALTCGSFYYQRMGPEIGIYGNMCEGQPHGFCYGLLLGGGFPLHYVLDQPGISVENNLGIDDNFLIIPFLIDVLFYAAIVYGICRLLRSYRTRKQIILR